MTRSSAVLTFTLKKLFEENLKGFGTKFKTVSLKNGLARVYLQGDLKLDGALSGTIFKTNLQGTVFQYKNVESLDVFVNGEIFD